MIGHGVPGLEIRQEYDFTSTCAALFTALTLSLDAWWPFDVRLTGPSGRLSLLPELGAPMIETGAGGGGVIWGVVDAIEPDRRLYLNGWFGVQGVVAGRVHFDISETATGSRLLVQHHAIGPVPEDLNTRYRALWRRILGTSLREHLAGTPV